MCRVHSAGMIAVVLFSLGCTRASLKLSPAPGEGQAMNEKSQQNPLLEKFATPFGVPPFDRIKPEHYLPSFDTAILSHQQEISAIVDNEAAPSFANTLEALNDSGELLNQVGGVFFNLLSASTNEQMQKIATEVAPKLARHDDDILLNRKLFQRIKAVYENRAGLSLSAEQKRLLEKTYKDFVRGGANLDERKQAELRGINQKLAVLSLTFSNNVLKEDNSFQLVLEKKEDLSGLPPSVLAAAAEAAQAAGKQGLWMFTLHKPSLIPFLQYADRRDLREKMFRGYINRGNHDDDRDNKSVLIQMADLRIQRAHLLGYKTHAHYVLEENMAKDPSEVYDLLQKLWQAAVPVTLQEAAKLQKMARKENPGLELQPWDWWYYAEKLRKAEYDLNEEDLRPYFALENVQQGAFDVASRLYGITFVARRDLPVYHPDVRAYEVREADGRHLGVLYVDYFPRASKSGGAWMNEYRSQQVKHGAKVNPVISNVFNFSRPTEGKPALLSFEEVTTLFHEFGHALHGLFSDVRYVRLAGTSVSRDFVELPSQIMENWASEPDVLRMYAKHYLSGKVIPEELIAKLEKSRTFNQGFVTTEYLAASFLDMDWHTLDGSVPKDVNGFETEVLSQLGLMPEIVSRYRSTYFNHIFGGEYSSGYYSYIWSAVLDADAFEAFKEKNNVFDRELAQAFRRYILSRGGTEDPMTLYREFRGAAPKIDALLTRRGLNLPKNPG